jgi:hypothetical protein
MFPVSLKEMNSNYYKLIFEFKGSGAGGPNSSIARQFDIDLSFNQEQGLIRCWGYDLSSSSAKRQLGIQPSEWDEYFSPNEDRKRIIEMITSTFMTY